MCVGAAVAHLVKKIGKKAHHNFPEPKVTSNVLNPTGSSKPKDMKFTILKIRESNKSSHWRR